MAKEKPRLLKVGKNGEIKLPLDVLEALGHEEGEEVRIYIDTRRKQLRIERYVDDPWGEALKKKEERGFEDLMGDQKARDEAAKNLFEERLKKAKPEKKDPKDDPDYWR